MAKLIAKDSNGNIVFPYDLPIENLGDVLYSNTGAGDHKYTATKPCVLMLAATGQHTTTITRNGVAYGIPGGIATGTFFLDKGDAINVPGHSNWGHVTVVYGVTYPAEQQGE